MSFNKHDIIDRTNYEEYFLLYVDGELSSEQAAAVEAFAALHPDLQEELSVLLNTKLSAEPVLLKGKEELFADNMKINAIEESLLLYIDNELSAHERKMIDQRIKTDPALQLQYQVLQKTKLDAADKIIYPYKAELYHSQPKAIRPVFWLRIAAAIILILSISLLWWTTTDSKVEPVVAVQEKPAINKQLTTDNDKTPVTDTKNLAIENNTKTGVTPKETNNNIAKKKIIITNKPAPVQPFENDEEDIAMLKTGEPVIDKKINSIETIKTPQPTLNTQAVTTDAITAYTTIEAAANNYNAVAATGNENDKKGSVRGFLRKATRFIERRTGVNPTNEDDELLISAIAIKL
ncbi:MAG: anti-sigma factor [Chitinophagaceae bacterium]